MQRTADLYQPVDEDQSLYTCTVIRMFKKIKSENRHRRTDMFLLMYDFVPMMNAAFTLHPHRSVLRMADMVEKKIVITLLKKNVYHSLSRLPILDFEKKKNSNGLLHFLAKI